MIQRVAVVYKPTEPAGWPTDPRRRQAQREHRRALDVVVGVLRRAGLSCDLIQRFRAIQQRRYDLIVTVGGDGTVLTTAHQVTEVPLLAVNSAPRFSEGFLTATDREGFARLLRALLAGRLRPMALRRLALVLNGRRLPVPVLNDLLVAESNPAMISRYALTIGTRSAGAPGVASSKSDSRTEVQRSSGIWVATASGSTAAIRSAGGRVLPLHAATFQYAVREPYAGRERRGGMRLLGGCLAPPAAIRLRSLMHRGMIFIDGAHVTYPLRYGDRLVVRADGPPLWVVGLRRR